MLKIKSILVSLLALGAMASCSTNELEGEDTRTGADLDGLCKLNCVMLYSHLISSVGDRPAPRGGTTRPDERKITTI